MQSRLLLPTDRPHWTRTGRVVYSRKKHEWSAKDIRRIINFLYPPEELSAEQQGSWFFEILRQINEFMLARILAIVGLEAAAGAVERFLESMVNWLFNNVLFQSLMERQSFERNVLRLFQSYDSDYIAQLFEDYYG
jgi:hypothetical protein